jgi:hypothetical protein
MVTRLVGGRRGSIARTFRHIRFGTKDTCGLVSRCGHHGLPNCNVATRAAENRLFRLTGFSN